MHEVTDRALLAPGAPARPAGAFAAAVDAAQAGDRHREQLARRWEGAPARRPREPRGAAHRPRWLGRYTRLVVAADLVAVAGAVLLTGVRPAGPGGALALAGAVAALVAVLALGGA